MSPIFDDGDDNDMEIEDMTKKSTDKVVVCDHNKDEFNSLQASVEYIFLLHLVKINK